MTDRRDEIAAELERGLAETVSFFKSLSLGDLRTQVYQDGAQWTVQQVLAHFAAIERSDAPALQRHSGRRPGRRRISISSVTTCLRPGNTMGLRWMS